MGRISALIMTGVTIGIITILFVQITSGLLGVFPAANLDSTDDVEIEGATGEVAISGDEAIREYNSVQSTLGDAVELTGASDSAVDVQASASVSGDQEVCTYATADSSAVSNDETRVLYQVEDMVLFYNGSVDEYQTWFFDDGSRESATVGVAANDATTRTLVCGQVDGSTLTVYRNTTQGATEALDGNQVTTEPANNNWDGTIEETRIFNRSLNSSQRSELNTTPALAVTGDAAAIRLTYDSFESNPNSVGAYFASGDAKLSNASLASGVSGPALTEGTDYETGGQYGQEVSVLDGGQLDDDGEVLQIEYRSERLGAPKDQAIDAISVAAQMMPVLVITLVSAAILISVRRIQ